MKKDSKDIFQSYSDLKLMDVLVSRMFFVVLVLFLIIITRFDVLLHDY